MTTSPLPASLERAWGRAVAKSASEDLPREFVNVLLPLMPEVAGDLLRAHEPRAFNALFLMLDHPALLGRQARDLFLERVTSVILPVSAAELITEAALDVAPDARGVFRELARSSLARETRVDNRVGGMLAWRRAEPDDVAARLTAEAFALLPSLHTRTLPRVIFHFLDKLSAADREAFLARLDLVPAAEIDQDILLSRCALSAPSERVALANAAIERATHAPKDKYFFTALSASRIVGHAPLLPWFERYLRELDALRDLEFALFKLGPHLPPSLLDLAEERMRPMGDAAWRKTEVLALLSRFHPARREALRVEVREHIERIVGDPVRGTRLRPEEYRGYLNIDATRANVAMNVSAAFDGDERRALQLRALAIVERTDTGVEQRHGFEGPQWSALGAALHPTLRAEAVRVALAMRYRPTALKAAGELVETFPPESRHLALLGLSRLAEGTAPQNLPRALEALHTASTQRTAALATRAKTDRAEVPWTESDEAALVYFKDHVVGTAGYGEHHWRPVCEHLTPEAARRAAAFTLTLEYETRRHHVALALADLPSLRGTVEHEALVAELLVPRGRIPPLAHQVQAVAQRLLAVCPERDDVWAARTAAYLDGFVWEIEGFLDVVEAFAPVLSRLGGPKLARDFAARLRAPRPTTEIARPWAQSLVGDFDA